MNHMISIITQQIKLIILFPDDLDDLIEIIEIIEIINSSLKN